MVDNNCYKVVFITEMTGVGGGETSLLNLLEDIIKKNSSPLLVCPEGRLYWRACELRIPCLSFQFPSVHLRLGLLPTFSIKTIIDLFRIIQDHHADVVHAESLLGLYYGGLAAWLAGVPCVATYHGYWRLHSRLSRIFLSHFCQRIYPVSESIASELKKFLGGGKTNIRVLPLGVNKTFFGDLPPQLTARKMLYLPLDRPIVMQVARFQDIKGQMNLLEALIVMLKQQVPKVPLVVFVGDVIEPISQEALLYKAQFLEKANNPELSPHIRLLGERADIPLLMRAADVIVNPSFFESFSMTTVEAMAVGTPVVSTAAGGPKEIIQDQVTGILVEPQNPTALADAIQGLICSPSWSRELADRAKSVARERYGPSVRYDTLMTEYFGLIKHHLSVI